jgi:hypothetical protein
VVEHPAHGNGNGNGPQTAAAQPEIEIYGYPHSVFPPTDFHTATYIPEHPTTGKACIYVIGGLGYMRGPHRDATITHRLDLDDFSMHRVETTGEHPPPVDNPYREDRTAVLEDGNKLALRRL